MKKGNVNNSTNAELFQSFSLVFLDYFIPCASVAQLNSTLALRTHLKVWPLVFTKKTLLSSVTT